MYTSFFKEHAKTKVLGVLEILQIKYKDIYTWVERTILSLHYSQYLFPLVNRSGFFKPCYAKDLPVAIDTSLG